MSDMVRLYLSISQHICHAADHWRKFFRLHELLVEELNSKVKTDGTNEFLEKILCRKRTSKKLTSTSCRRKELPREFSDEVYCIAVSKVRKSSANLPAPQLASKCCLAAWIRQSVRKFLDHALERGTRDESRYAYRWIKVQGGSRYAIQDNLMLVCCYR